MFPTQEGVDVQSRAADVCSTGRASETEDEDEDDEDEGLYQHRCISLLSSYF